MNQEMALALNDSLLHPVLFLDPENLNSSAWAGHIPFAYWLMNAAKPKRMVELGTHNGVSYCAFLQAVVHLGIKTEAYAVDTWQGEKHAGFYGKDIYQTLSEFHDPKYASFSTLLRMTFDEALDKFEDGSVDLLHIDGLHTYDAVKKDFDTWLPKLSNSGLVIMHDIQVRTGDFGVWKFWEELQQRYPSFAFTHSSGLGVLAVGKEQAPPIHWLINQSNNTEAMLLIRSLFSTLGSRFTEIEEMKRIKFDMQNSSSWKLAMLIRKLASPFSFLRNNVKHYLKS